MNKVKLNAYKIKTDFIPEKVNKYRFNHLENEANIYQTVTRLGGVLTNRDKLEFVSISDLSHDENLKQIESTLISNLPKYIQENLVQFFLKDTHKIKDVLYKSLQEIRPSKKINDLVVRTLINDIEVKKVNNDFYIVPDIYHSVKSYDFLWKYSSNNLSNLQDLVGRKILSRIDKSTNRKYVIDVVEPDKDGVNFVLNYAINILKYGSVENIEKEFGKIDYNQPVILSRQKNITLKFLPQFCNLSYDTKDVQDNPLISRYWSLKNSDKANLIDNTIKGLDDKITNALPKSFSYIKHKNPKLIVKNENNDLVEVNNTNNLFSWITDESKIVYLPHYSPDIIKNTEIPFFILIDETLDEEKRKQIETKFKDLIKRYKKIQSKSNNDLPNLKMLPTTFKFSSNDYNCTLNDIKKSFNNFDAKLGLAVIFSESKDINSDIYGSIKRQLFQMDIISQNITWKKWHTDKDGYMTNNLLLQIMSKLGVKYFALKTEFEYDLILGLDVGLGEYGNHRVGGCTVIFDSNGYIKRIQTIETASPGETLNLKRVFEYLKNKTDVDLFDKRILLIRDGNVQDKEISDLSKISSEISSNITVLNIKKDNKYNIYDDNLSGVSVLLEDIGILLPHRTSKDKASNPLKIDSKYNFVNGTSINSPYAP